MLGIAEIPNDGWRFKQLSQKHCHTEITQSLMIYGIYVSGHIASACHSVYHHDQKTSK